MNHRDAVLEGSKKATRLHEVLGCKERVDRTNGRIDVFDAIIHQGPTLLFQELGTIIGAYVNEGNPGILVTTLRPLSVQRYTAAHELGHFYMGHEPCVDGDEILQSSASLNAIETEANAFAAEFLAPKWLLFYHGKRQKWTADSITDPVVVYQLALRLGLSYEATCYSLRAHGIVGKSVVQSLLNISPKKIKRQILPATYEPANWFTDVWLLTERDRDSRIEGHPEDHFVLRHGDKPGVVWDLSALQNEGFEIIADDTRWENALAIREITLGAAPAVEGKVTLACSTPPQSWSVDYDVAGKEKGMPRLLRKKPAVI